MNLDIGSRTTIVLVLVIVLSGCAGFVSERTETPADGTTSQDSVTETTAQKTASESIYDLPLSTETLLDRHESALDSAGSFTVIDRTHYSQAKTGAERKINTTTRGNVETGELYTVQNWSEAESGGLTDTGVARSIKTYVGASGEGYTRKTYGSDDFASYDRASSHSNLTAHLRPNIGAYLEQATFEYDGVQSVSGTTTHVYAASSPDSFEEDSDGRIIGYDANELTNASVRLFVTDDGLLKRFAMRVEVTTDGEPMEAHLESTYRNVGETTVEPPTWLPDAKRRVADLPPDPMETVTEEVEDETLGATITATGPRYAIDNVGIERQSGGVWDTGGEGYQRAQASSLVSVRSWGEATIETVELSYDDSLFPSEEARLAIYRFDRGSQTFVEVETTLDTDANVAYADIDREGTYLVMHTETWNSLFE